MGQQDFFQRYQQLQVYVRWSEDDVARIATLREIIRPHFSKLIDDFYATIGKHAAARRVIVGGDLQIRALKKSLRQWLDELFSGQYDESYVRNRSAIGRRHVEIGLDQVYTNAAISRLRSGMSGLIQAELADRPKQVVTAILTLDKLLDLDLSIIENAYESEHVHRQQVAERARMAGVLHQERAFSEGLWEQAPAIVLVLDVDARIIRYNSYLQQLSGVPFDEVKGRDWFEVFVLPEDRQNMRTVFQKTLQREDVSGTVSGILTRAGRNRSISWSHRALTDVKGETVAVLAVGQDITELDDAQRRALQSERLAAIGQMSTGLAHEGRNALQRIQACAEMLELEVDGNDEAMDLVRRIKLAQDHMHRLFDEVRGYAAPVTLDRSEVELAGVWREAWELLQQQLAGRQAELIDLATTADRWFWGDHFRLVQLFRILLENALAACQDPVRITIDCRSTLLGQHEALQVSVCDNGPGVRPDQRELVFQPFYTTKTKGTGLGLAIAQRIVEAHQGVIEVGERDGEGAEILVTLPLVEDES